MLEIVCAVWFAKIHLGLQVEQCCHSGLCFLTHCDWKTQGGETNRTTKSSVNDQQNQRKPAQFCWIPLLADTKKVKHQLYWSVWKSSKWGGPDEGDGHNVPSAVQSKMPVSCLIRETKSLQNNNPAFELLMCILALSKGSVRHPLDEETVAKMPVIKTENSKQSEELYRVVARSFFSSDWLVEMPRN